jgi:hypothetical protein
MLPVGAASEAELARAENSTLDGGGVSGVQILKMKKKDQAEWAKLGGCPKCHEGAFLSGKMLLDAIDRAHQRALEIRSGGR